MKRLGHCVKIRKQQVPANSSTYPPALGKWLAVVIMGLDASLSMVNDIGHPVHMQTTHPLLEPSNNFNCSSECYGNGY